MDHHVFVSVASVVESLVAHLARERFLSSVYPLMSDFIAATREGLGTEQARKVSHTVNNVRAVV